MIEQVLEGNKLIAEYLGMELVHKVYTNSLDSEGGKYHKSLDWLIPVINKIKQTEEISIISNGPLWDCEIETSGYHYATQAYNSSESLVEAVWLSCVEYIKNYNAGTLKVAKK